MTGSVAACAVSCRLHRVNFAAIMITANEAETETFRASEGFHAHGFRITSDALFQVKILFGQTHVLSHVSKIHNRPVIVALFDDQP